MNPKTARPSPRSPARAKPAPGSPSYPGAVRGPSANAKSERGTELPHERDETTGPDRKEPPDAVVEQAYKDVKSGKTDTDLRSNALATYKRSPRKGPRSP